MTTRYLLPLPPSHKTNSNTHLETVIEGGQGAVSPAGSAVHGHMLVPVGRAVVLAVVVTPVEMLREVLVGQLWHWLVPQRGPLLRDLWARLAPVVAGQGGGNPDC